MTSEPTIYREAEPWSDGAIATWVVPVEPCEHSNMLHPNGHIDGHWTIPGIGDGEWCPGAGIGETPVVLDDFENMILDRALDRMEGIGGDE